MFCKIQNSGLLKVYEHCLFCYLGTDVVELKCLCLIGDCYSKTNPRGQLCIVAILVLGSPLFDPVVFFHRKLTLEKWIPPYCGNLFCLEGCPQKEVLLYVLIYAVPNYVCIVSYTCISLAGMTEA